MKIDVFILSFMICMIFLGITIYLIRNGKLREQYAILWLILTAVMMLLSLFPSLIDFMAKQIGVSYAPSLLYLLGLISVLFILLHLTIAVSSLTARFIVLTQKIGMLEQENLALRQGNKEISADPAIQMIEAEN
ncbi:DUF2304 domain-containing protein [Paenibacillus lutimineralis]|uniref:DUF2304 domain-containing protein n=1 Tax=Paenibacillus lutimineralis TaxID=2707005 RepID=A0A3Q9ICK4_9BACL|nr:DUF2304 domain-containing protein [Paenibacillus lutimineralis]AZS17825.1 DUF2304 domain-containing protein [Paenibacillus lutimineralis]